MGDQKYQVTIERCGQVRRYGPTIREGVIHTDDPESVVKPWLMEFEGLAEKPDWWQDKLVEFRKVEGGWKYKTEREYLD